MSSKNEKAQRWLTRNDSRLKEVILLLKLHYNSPVRSETRSGLQILVLTVLSQNTTDPNALKAYQNLIKKFPGKESSSTDNLPRDKKGNIDTVKIRMSMAADSLPEPAWAKISKTPQTKLEDTIKICGLQKAKAAAILNILKKTEEETGSFNLDDFIGDLKPLKAVRRLTEIKGVGVKTAAVTLLEAYGADLCPVDTHVYRICQRLKLVKGKSRDRTFYELGRLIPEGEGYALHHNLLSFGRTICTARSPACENCFLQRLCYDYRCRRGGENKTLKFIAG